MGGRSRVKTRVFRKSGVWYYIGARYQGAHCSLRTLLREAEQQGEFTLRKGTKLK